MLRFVFVYFFSVKVVCESYLCINSFPVKICWTIVLAFRLNIYIWGSLSVAKALNRLTSVNQGQKFSERRRLDTGLV